jgi:Protein of unknown function, DUF417
MIAERATPVQSFGVRPEAAAATGARLEALGLNVARYALVLVLVWIGLMKFTAYEAGAIQPLVANSPLMFWLYGLFSVQATSNLIGVAEIVAGVLIAIRPWSASAGVVGSLGAEPRRLSGALGGARPVHPEGRRAARRRHLVTRRIPPPRGCRRVTALGARLARRALARPLPALEGQQRCPPLCVTSSPWQPRPCLGHGRRTVRRRPEPCPGS